MGDDDYYNPKLWRGIIVSILIVVTCAGVMFVISKLLGG